MYQYNSIMSAVNDFIDEVNESDSEAKLVKPHTIKDAYELLAGYYGKETGKALLEEYESGRPHDVADATKLLLDVLKNKEENKGTRWPFYYVSDGEPIHLFTSKNSNEGLYLQCDEGTNIACVRKCQRHTDGIIYIYYVYIFPGNISPSLFYINNNGDISNTLPYNTKTIDATVDRKSRTAVIVCTKEIANDSLQPTNTLFRNYIQEYDTTSVSVGLSGANSYEKFTDDGEHRESLGRQGETAWNHGVVFPLPDRS